MVFLFNSFLWRFSTLLLKKQKQTLHVFIKTVFFLRFTLNLWSVTSSIFALFCTHVWIVCCGHHRLQDILLHSNRSRHSLEDVYFPCMCVTCFVVTMMFMLCVIRLCVMHLLWLFSPVCYKDVRVRRLIGWEIQRLELVELVIRWVRCDVVDTCFIFMWGAVVIL